jgi:two-component system sensor histidine kinase HydH
LASIKGAADILIDDETSRSEREEFKDILQTEIRRIDATVSEFLEFARPRETRKERLNLTKTLQASLRQLEAQVKRQGSSVQAQLEANVFVSGDQEKVHQMTLNVVLNAIHASHDGDTVNVSLNTEDGAAARLIFTDSGAGISAADLPHVFEPFFTTKSTGTGLGLTVVKDIVDSHQGEILVESREKHGTTVTIVLPLYAE